MKFKLFTTTRRVVLLTAVCGIIGTLVIGCSDHTIPEKPLQSCRIASIVTGSSIQSWEYTTDGQPKSYSLAGNPLSEYNGQITYTYDANQFLITNTNTNRDNTVRSVGTFEYTNNRLTKWVVKSSSGDILGSRTFEYDDSGKLSRYVDIYQLVKDTFIFSDGKLTGHTTERIESNGNLVSFAEKSTYENGRRKTTYSPANGQTISYIYDVQGRIVRSETRVTDTLARIYAVEYTDGKSVLDAYTLPKGWPHELRYYPGIYHEYLSPDEVGIPGLDTKNTSYGVPMFLVPITRKMEEVIKSYTKNDGEFPIELNSVANGETYFGSFDQFNKPFNVIITPYYYTERTIYTYTGCQ